MKKKTVDEHLVEELFYCYKCNVSIGVSNAVCLDYFQTAEGELLVKIDCTNCGAHHWFTVRGAVKLYFR